MDSIFDKPSESPGFLLWQVTNTWQKHIRHALQRVDLTHVQFVLLASCWWLSGQNERMGVTQVQLAQHAKVDVMMTSQVLRTLEKKNYIKRTPHPKDTRANLITLTTQGERIVSQAVKIVEEADLAFFSKLENELPRFVRLLNRLVDE
ncbi:MarR family transcriptional regulator [Brevibacillus sp. SYP-B805]|uniref:MarR family winged helix-turn-helix transcriptional regulator n=1 Tax=Brevibacillus sp. SYP-B805 TaxID=1578199 RepID=UPI0013EC1447|nr:MarR family transcriptional regulator [Brevibacillus sp. SYP-B805]NGQ95234.1 MarR family transcriptional regulator [Brevibacillus sp. SYP-B805]